MRATRRVFILTAFLSALFLSAAAADAQTAVSYHFLEVSDADGKPVADAKVETVGWGPVQTKQTDERGQVKDMPVRYGDFSTRALKISKPGFLSYESTEVLDKDRYADVFESVIPQYDERAPVKVTLLREPVTAAEREGVEAEQRRRELLRAVKRRDVEVAEKLLRAGVSPDAAGVNGIPSILFAAANEDVAMIKALLAAGADVRSAGGPGRKALLFYLLRAKPKAIDVELVRSLVNAGADVNAADKYGATVLVLSKQSNKPDLVRLIERAGARQ